MLASGIGRCRAVVVGILVVCLQLGVIAVGSASAAAPTVTLTRYSRTVTGNIGSATAGVNVTVSLVRAGTTVDTASTVVTDASGNWTAVLPDHAPSGGNDIINVDYSGTGAPANSSYGDTGPFTAPGFDDVDARASISADGSHGGFNCRSPFNPSLDCAGVTATVSYANGTMGTVQGTVNSSYFHVWDVAFSPAVGLNDTVTFSQPYSGPNGSTLVLAEPAPLPGVGNNVSAGFGTGGANPTCSADLVTRTVTCGPLAIGSYDLVQSGGGASTHTATISTQGASASFQLSSLQAGDMLALNLHGAGGRTVTVLHVAQLRLDEKQNAAGQSPTVSGGSCQPLEWFYNSSSGVGGTPPPLCSSTGTAPAGSQTPTALRDELSGGSTAVTMPAPIQDTSPMYGEDVSGPSIVAFADLAGADTSPVGLTVQPIGGGTGPTVSGNANSATGTTITGLVAGKRYTAAWVVTDAHGDTVTLDTNFVDQTGNSGPVGSPGSQGAPGPQGKPGPAWTSLKVCVHRIAVQKLHQKARSVFVVACRMQPIAPRAHIRLVEAKLTRNGIVYAIGHSTRLTYATRLVLRHLRRIRPGRYTLTLVLVTPGSTTTVRSTITIR